jgi:type IV pilus assembly protein PilE
MSTPATVASKYTIAITLADGPPAAFTITATPITGTNQAGDGTLSITSTGARAPSDKW